MKEYELFAAVATLGLFIYLGLSKVDMRVEVNVCEKLPIKTAKAPQINEEMK